jgi:hypothetical protein
LTLSQRAVETIFGSFADSQGYREVGGFLFADGESDVIAAATVSVEDSGLTWAKLGTCAPPVGLRFPQLLGSWHSHASDWADGLSVADAAHARERLSLAKTDYWLI